ncbi:MAG: hypothetical protein ACK46Q_15260 [Hyphomonas sp.]
MKNTAIPLLSVPLLLLAGCATSLSAVRGAVDQAPDWYGERRSEIRGEGYPELVDVPVVDRANMPGRGLPARRARGGELIALFENNPRAEAPQGGMEEILELAAEIRAGFAGYEPADDFLSEADLAVIRSSFNVPRVTQD